MLVFARQCHAPVDLNRCPDQLANHLLVMGSLGRNIMPCAACKTLRRRCTDNCIFLPYFSPAEPEKFAAVHRIFGASNISKLLQEIPVDDRDDAVSSMVYEATARLKDPVYGCVGLIASLQKHIFQLQSELNAALGEVLALRTQLSNALPRPTTSSRAYSSAGGLEEIHQPQLLNESSYFTNPFDAMLVAPHLLDSSQAVKMSQKRCDDL